MSVIEKALLKATKIKPQGKSEDRQKYLSRLVAGVQKLPDDAWEDLESTPGAQEWVNAGVDAEESKKLIGDFPDLVSEDDADDSSSSDDSSAAEEGEVDSASEGGRKKKAAVGAKKKSETSGAASSKKVPHGESSGSKKKVEAPRKDVSKAASSPKKGTSMRRQLKMIIVKKPKTSVDDLIASLEKKGYESPSKMTVASIRADTRDTLRVLNEVGLIEIEL